MKGFKIARIFGIDIEIHWSWFFVLIFFSSYFAKNHLPKDVPDQEQGLYWLFGIAITLMVFLSVLCHELAHAAVMRKFKILVQVIVLFILGGAAFFKESAKEARTEFLMALAGPVSNLLMAGLFFIASAGAKFWQSPELILVSLIYLVIINVGLAVFNILPVFPMDGGRVFRAIIWWRLNNLLKATKIAVFIGKIFAFLMFLGGGFLMIFYGDFWSGLQLILLSIFLLIAAEGELNETKKRHYNAE